MPRPTLVIGLGGTGQWVLRFVKREMLEVHGKVPDNVRLLCFDTEAPGIRGVGVPDDAADSGRQREQQALFGSVELQNNVEYHWLTGDVNALIDAIIAGEHPELAEWFPAGYYKDTMSPGERNLTTGAAAWRQFGRLAVFADLQRNAGSLITSQIARTASAIMAADANISDVRPLEVVIATSLVGGTGAGMAVDMANLVHHQLRSAQIRNYCVRGVFVLPRAFGAWDDNSADAVKKQARAFAAWQELDRFRLSGGVVRGIPMRYTDNLARTIDEPLFDNTYLVDGARSNAGGANLNPPDSPQYHVFPTVADFVGMLIDEESGPRYSAWAVNLRQLQQSSYRPYYGAIGSWTIRSSARNVMREHTHNLGKAVVSELVGGGAAPVAAVASGNAAVAALVLTSDRNREQYPDFRGRDNKVLMDFMTAGAQTWSTTNEHVRVPDLLRDIAEIAFADPQTLAERLTQYAGIGDISTRLKSNFVQLDGPEDEEAFDKGAAMQHIDEICPASFTPGASRPETWFGTYQQPIANWKRSTHGDSGSADLDSRGAFGRQLRKVRDAQVKRFGELLRVWLLRTLMGESDDPTLARAGKLGFALDFMGRPGEAEMLGLLFALDRYYDFVNKKVRAQRAKVESDARNNEKIYEDYMVQVQSKKIVLQDLWRKIGFRLTPEKWQEYYRGMLHQYMTVLADESLLLAREQTVQLMMAAVRSARAELQRWADALAGDADRGIASLADGIERHRSQAAIGTVWDSNQLAEVQQVLAAPAPDADRTTHLVSVMLDALSWQVVTRTAKANNDRDDTVGFDIDLKMLPLRDGAAEQDLDSGTDAAVLQKNVAALTVGAEAVLDDIRTSQRVATRLLADYDDTAAGRAGLVNYLENLGMPLYMANRGATVISRWLRVRTGTAEESQFFIDVEAALRTRGAVRQQTRSQSEDPYRLSMVLTDEIIDSTSFTQYAQVKRLYERQARDYRAQGLNAGALLHVHAPDQNALNWALDISELTQQLDEFEPQIKAAMGNSERLGLFFWALLLGFVRYDDYARQWYADLFHVGRDGRLAYREDGTPRLDRTIQLTEDIATAGQRRDGRVITDALVTFCLRGVDVTNSANRVDFARMRDAIKARLRELGLPGVEQLSKRFLFEPDGWIEQWKDARHNLTLHDGAQAVAEIQGISNASLYRDMVRLAVLSLLDSARSLGGKDFPLSIDLGDEFARKDTLKELYA